MSNRGKVYVYHGSPAGPGDTPAWSRSGDAAGDLYGYPYTAGDVNGDGYDDLSSAHHTTLHGGGQQGLPLPWFAGRPHHSSSDWTAVSVVTQDAFGWSVATAGDVNGDGYADLVVGAPYNGDNGTNAGKVYVYYGSPTGLSTPGPYSTFGECVWLQLRHSWQWPGM